MRLFWDDIDRQRFSVIDDSKWDYMNYCRLIL